MDRLKERGVAFGTSLTVTRHNIDQLTSDAFFEHLYKRGDGLLAVPLPSCGQRPRRVLDAYPRTEGIYEAARQPTPSKISNLYRGFLETTLRMWGDALPAAVITFTLMQWRRGNVCVFTHFAVDKIHDKALLEVLQSDFFRTIRSKQPYSKISSPPA